MYTYVRECNGECIATVEGDARTVWKSAYRSVRSGAQVMAGEFSFRPYPPYIPGILSQRSQYKRVRYSKEQGLQYYA